MGWLRKRFAEKSTFSGLAFLGSLLTLIVGPEAAAVGAQSAALLVGLYEVVRQEK